MHSVHDFIRFVAAVFTHQLLSLKSLAGGKHAFLVHDLSVVLVHLEAVLVVHSVSWWRESTKPEWKGLMRCEQATLLLPCLLWVGGARNNHIGLQDRAFQIDRLLIESCK